MVGISHVAFRELVRYYTPKDFNPIIFTEMLSTRRIPNQNLELADRLFCADNEQYFIPQLLGNEENLIRDSINRLMPLKPWGFDINMGCPSMKTLGHNWGVLLMGDKEYAADVVRFTKKYSPVPVSVKMRAGFGDEVDLDYLLSFTEKLEQAGADWMTIHCRARGQRHKGPARWDIVEKLAKERSVPIVGNGDLQTADDAIRVLKEFKLSGAMIARGAVARPWILLQIAKKLGMETGDIAVPMTPDEEGAEYFKSILRLADLLEKYFGDNKQSTFRLQYHIGVGHKWLLFGHDFWKTVMKTKSLKEARDVIYDYSVKYPQPLEGRIRL